MTELPQFYDASKVGTLYTPDLLGVTASAKAVNVGLASDDERRTALLLIDMQVDFIHAQGALSVPNAVEDTKRTIEWLYHHLGKVTTIFASLDSHLPLQIFSPGWWVNRSGEHPAPFTVITADDVARGDWVALYEETWSRGYVGELEERAKKQLMIWPYHTLLGTQGHMLMPALYEAIAYHSSARRTQPQLISKGSIAKSENYSIFEPEVKLPDLPHGGLNVDLLETIGTYDAIYIAGEAKSHCVLETVASMVRYFEGRPDVLTRLHLLEDCMSSVAHPEIDFEAIAREQFEQFKAQGVNIVRSA